MQLLPESTSTSPILSPSVRKGAIPASYTEIPGSGGFADPAPEAESGSLLEYARILQRRKGTLILIACLGTLIGFLVTIPQMPVYQVRTSLEIVGLNANFLNVKESNPLNEGGTSSSDAVDIQTQVKILQSESLVDRVFDKLRSGPLPDAPPDRTIAWRKYLNLPAPAPVNPREEALLYAKRNFKGIRQTNPGQLRAACQLAGVRGATSETFLPLIPGRIASK